MPVWWKHGIVAQYEDRQVLQEKKIIESNGWCLDPFMVKVGAIALILLYLVSKN